MPAPNPPAGYPMPDAPAPRKRHVGWWIAGGITAVLVLGCCGVGAGAVLLSDLPAGDDGPPAMSAGDYHQLIARIDGDLGTAMGAVTTATSPAKVSNATEKLRATTSASLDEIRGTNPPKGQAAAHGALLDALVSMDTTAAATGSAADAYEVCTGTSAAAMIARSEATKATRAAAQLLAQADPPLAQPFAAYLPEPTPDANRRLKHGAFLARPNGGSGHLKITGGKQDALVTLARKGAKKPTLSVYIRAKAKLTITGIRDGDYRVYIANGVDWDPRAKRFNRDCGYQRDTTGMRFSTSSATYTIWRLTLQAGAAGNVPSEPADPDTFPI
ncbi:hypothetical protein GCM10010201_27570 [Pilimelia columellifera subsp. columellifera]|uniref:Uncharacterized protein n=2 Tax=Pilimelia TaxID=53370 RepID=A0ABN3NN70_9ACTN